MSRLGLAPVRRNSRLVVVTRVRGNRYRLRLSRHSGLRMQTLQSARPPARVRSVQAYCTGARLRTLPAAYPSTGNTSLTASSNYEQLMNLVGGGITGTGTGLDNFRLSGGVRGSGGGSGGRATTGGGRTAGGPSGGSGGRGRTGGSGGGPPDDGGERLLFQATLGRVEGTERTRQFQRIANSIGTIVRSGCNNALRLMRQLGEGVRDFFRRDTTAQGVRIRLTQKNGNYYFLFDKD